MKFDYAIKGLLHYISYLEEGFERFPIMIDIDENEAREKIKELKQAIKILKESEEK